MTLRPLLRGYPLAALLVTLVTAIKLTPVVDVSRDSPLVFYLLAVIVAGLYGDVRSALFATALSVFAAWFFFVRPAGNQEFALLRLGAVALGGLVIVAFDAELRRVRAEVAGLLEKRTPAPTHETLFGAQVSDSEALRTQLQRLEQLTLRLSKAMTREEVAEIVVDLGVSSTNADTCTLYTLDEAGQGLDLLAHRGIHPQIFGMVQRIERSAGNPTFRVLSSGEPLWVERESEYLELFPKVAGIRTDGPRAKAFWCVPLTAEGTPFGLLGMGYYAPRDFGPRERAFVETFTRHCAEALRRAQRLTAEQDAHATAERLRASLATTLRSIGDGVIATDSAGKVTLMNAVAEDLTGHREDESRGKPLAEVFRIVNEETGESVESPVAKVLRDGVIVGLANHTVLVARDGSSVAIDDSGAPIRGPDGRIEGVILVFRDVTEKKREEARREFLAAATAALAESLDYEVTLSRVAWLSVPRLGDWCAVDVIEPGQRLAKRLAVAHVNPEKLELARKIAEKYPEPANAESGVPNVLRTGRAELHANITDEMLQAGTRDAEHLRLSRALGLVSAMVVPLVARGNVLGAMTLVSAESGRHYTQQDLAFAEELSQRCAAAMDNARLYAAEQRARAAADVANRSKDEFLASVSHELRTPLNAILGWAKMMSSNTLDESKRARAIETVERNAVAMAQLVEDLLDVSRIISGKMRLEVQSFDASRVAETALQSVRPAAEAKGIVLLANLQAPGPRLMGDPARIQQVIWNLLSNAVKFTPNGGQVELGVHADEAFTTIVVRDTGRGIDPDFLPFVFEPFRQESASHARSRGGLGLGLAIARQLVELHGGGIEVASAGGGKGATFSVRLPLAPESLQREPNAANDAQLRSRFDHPPELRGLRVLVVDDDEDARHLVSAVLEACGSHVLRAEGADTALELLQAQPVDVLVSDIGMPGQDGYDLIRRVRELPATRGGSVPAAALTAYVRAEDRRRVLNAGYSIHIPKPVEPAELVAVVASLVR